MTAHPSSLLCLLLPLAASQALAQGRTIPRGHDEPAAAAQEALPLPDGQRYRYTRWSELSLSVDVFDPLMRLVSFDHASYEVQAMVGIHHRFFPMLSFGMGEADETSDNGLTYDTDQVQELHYKSSFAPFGKIGLAYNLAYNDTHPSDFYLLFCRYGVAHHSADISNLYYQDETWGVSGPFSLLNQTYTTHWVELGALLKVQLLPHLSLGWDLYWKLTLAQSGTALGEPYYVPGFGLTDNSLGFAFRLYYDLF